MQEKLITKLKNALMKFKEPTRACKICFKDIKSNNIFNLLNKSSCLCSDCMRSLNAKFIKFYTDNVACISIYEYDEVLKNLIYQFKGCYDYELKDIFLNKYLREIRLMYKGYIIVPAPSSKEDDLKRGFNHVEEIYKSLNMPILKLFEKTEKIKQSDQSFQQRKNIGNFIKYIEKESIGNKRILLVDDIYTTGSTIKSLIKILKEQKVKDIKVLVICKTKLKENI